MLNFGVGKMFAIPSDPTITPFEFGVLQNVSVGFSWDKKELYGSLQFPQKVVRGKGKIDCKASFAQINSQAFNTLLGSTATTGQNLVTTVATTIPTATPWTVATSTNLINMGVWDVSNPLFAVPMTMVASAPTAGQYMYSTATGTYTFASADGGKKIQYSQMNDNGAGGVTMGITNSMLGTAPTFKTVLSGAMDGKAMTIVLNACMTTKFDLSFKQDDFTIPSFDFSAFADSSGSPGEITVAE